MKRLSVLLLLILAAGCATDRYRPTYLDNGSGYYAYGRSYPTVRYLYGYDSLYLYGMYPWWTHSFYSPWFYPYHFTYYHPFYDPYYGRYFFAGWSPSWPYYDSYYGRYGWATAPYRQPPVVLPDRAQPPGAGGTDGPAARDVFTGAERRRGSGERGYSRGYPADTYPVGKYPAPERPEGYRRSAVPPGASMPAERTAAPGGRAAPYGSARPGYPDLKARSVIPNVSAPPGPRTGPADGPRGDRSSGDRPTTRRDR
jgi:hypothetical protein